MNKKGIKKIVIPAIAIIVIIGGLVSYFMKPQEAQPVMAPLDTQQDLVEEKEEIPEETQEDTAIDNKEEENEIENEIVENEVTAEDEKESPSESDDSINSTHTDIILNDEEYKGDEETDLANMGLTEEDWEVIREIEAEVIAEYPELFTDTQKSTTSTTSTQTTQNNYEHVGTPSTGQFTNPNYSFGTGGDSGIPAGTVY